MRNMFEMVKMAVRIGHVRYLMASCSFQTCHSFPYVSQRSPAPMKTPTMVWAYVNSRTTFEVCQSFRCLAKSQMGGSVGGSREVNVTTVRAPRD